MGRVEQARNQVHQSRLARAGAPDDRGRLTRRGGERNVAEHRVLGAGIVKAHAIERKRAALHDAADRRGRRFDARLGVEHLLDSVSRDRRSRNHRHREGGQYHGHEDLHEIRQVCDQRADLH